jgi:RNA polymerase sigma-70 factor (ECF subfamily)
MWDDMYTSAMFLSQLRDPKNDDAWTKFHEMYGPGIRACCLRRGFSQQEAEDLSQEVLIKIVMAMPNFEYDRSKRFRNWLSTVIKNAALDFREKKERRKDAAAGGTDANGALVQNPDPYAEDPLTFSDRFSSEAIARLISAEAVNRVRARLRSPRVLACFDGVLNGRTVSELMKGLGENASFVLGAVKQVTKMSDEEVERLTRELDDPSGSV